MPYILTSTPLPSIGISSDAGLEGLDGGSTQGPIEGSDADSEVSSMKAMSNSRYLSAGVPLILPLILGCSFGQRQAQGLSSEASSITTFLSERNVDPISTLPPPEEDEDYKGIISMLNTYHEFTGPVAIPGWDQSVRTMISTSARSLLDDIPSRSHSMNVMPSSMPISQSNIMKCSRRTLTTILWIKIRLRFWKVD